MRVPRSLCDRTVYVAWPAIFLSLHRICGINCQVELLVHEECTLFCDIAIAKSYEYVRLNTAG